MPLISLEVRGILFDQGIEMYRFFTGNIVHW